MVRKINPSTFSNLVNGVFPVCNQQTLEVLTGHSVDLNKASLVWIGFTPPPQDAASSSPGWHDYIFRWPGIPVPKPTHVWRLQASWGPGVVDPISMDWYGFQTWNQLPNHMRFEWNIPNEKCLHSKSPASSSGGSSLGIKKHKSDPMMATERFFRGLVNAWLFLGSDGASLTKHTRVILEDPLWEKHQQINFVETSIMNQKHQPEFIKNNTFGSTPRAPGCNRHKWSFSSGFPNLKMECHPGGDEPASWGGG